MAQFKSLREKSKTYIFKVFDNEKSKNPAKAIFLRFPFTDELFPVASPKSIMESSIINNFNDTLEAKEQLVKYIIDTVVENMTANRFDYLTFIKECIDRFEDFMYGDKEIKTVNDFFSLPQEAIQKIARDLFLYSKIEDKFTMGE
jgi:hypothetical protein